MKNQNENVKIFSMSSGFSYCDDSVFRYFINDGYVVERVFVKNFHIIFPNV